MITRVNPDSPLAPGQPYPLGASAVDGGINFAIHSPEADNLLLCLYDANDQETERCNLPARTGDVWHGFMAGLGAGVRYGFRAEGDFDPEQGRLFNPAQLLIDPYARALSGPVESHLSLYSHDPDNQGSLTPGESDSAPHLPKALTPGIEPFDWQDSRPPRTPWPQTVLYELHIKGFSQRNPAVPPELRGTYLGLAHEASIRHLTDLGITAVQLMPCFAFMSEPRLSDAGLSNYWGYNPVGWFAPEPRYAVADAVGEFKTLVRTLHQAGIEVILDVVYNHTAEGDLLGPTLNHKGLYSRWFYRYHRDNPGHFVDHSGCGNSVDLHQLHPLTQVMDSLRYWLEEYRVDGFRFDLATSLGREDWDFSPGAAFFQSVGQDPLLRHAKLIAEPWDIGRGGYQLGHFPPSWYECNDRYRDTLRAYWRGDSGKLPELATRLMGSRDLLRKGVRAYSTSLNYISYHDGFTLEDLVSYNERHNAANRERNRDGHGHNLSHNWGVEGPTDDPAILELRQRTKRNLLASLLVSQGGVHLLGGDEIGRTQQGNNNAYCQDNEISWFDWEAADDELRAFVRQCIGLRRSSSLFHDLVFSEAELIEQPASSDRVHWYRPDGEAMGIDDWQAPEGRCLGVLLSTEVRDPASDLERCEDYYLLLFNAGAEDVDFRLPADPASGWQCAFDTAMNNGLAEEPPRPVSHSYSLAPHSLVVLGRGS